MTVRGDGGPLDRPDPLRLRGFVPIEDLAPPPQATEPPSVPPPLLADLGDGWETRTSLFGDADG